jgi:hypothetical protein
VPELGTCGLCGKVTMVHGNKGSGIEGGFGRRLMLCDDCCVCYNHAPGGKYWDVGMDGKKQHHRLEVRSK